MSKRTSETSKSMWGLVWSGMDGVLRRGASSIIALLLAVVADPHVVGFYSAAFIILTMYQGWFEGPLRQTSQRLFADSVGRRDLERTLKIGSIVGSLTVGVGIVAVGLYFRASPAVTIPLVFVAAAPLLSSRSMMKMIELQRRGRWGQLANIRLIASCTALTVSVPTLFIWDSLWAVPLQVLISEFVPLLCLRSVGVSSARDSLPMGHSNANVLIWQSSGPQILGWIRTQADRVVLMAIGAAEMLGLYSTALSVARMPIDAAMFGFVNHLRTELSVSSGQLSTTRKALYSFHVRVYGFSTVYIVAAILIGIPLLNRLLSDEWDDVYPAVIILLLSCIPSAQSTGITNTLIHLGEHRKVYPAQVLGIIMAALGGFVLTIDIFLGVWLFVFRELSISVILLIVGRRYITARGVVYFTIIFIVAFIFCLYSLDFYLK